MVQDNKVAIVTGGASGFGAQIGRTLCQRGVAVLLADINVEGAQSVADELTSTGLRAMAMKCDVSKQADFQAAVDAAKREWGGLHIVVNNAGTTHRNQPALEVSEQDFDRVFRVNLKSVYWSVHAAMPGFVEQGSGCIVNVASATGHRPGPGLTWYSASKAAMLNMTKGLALEFARHGVRVNAVNPMIGETAMLADFMGMPDTPENRQRFLARIPLGRFTRPQDVASAVAFLASDEADYLTGVCLDVDGGRHI
ncbi:SDR family oxidoreductase [Variovorax sp. J31P179]|uniref:SDR family oxidoreductase n=1 Tax=Variovorax sp. J31P179 TaxID=3053508 RepID=UPI002578A8F6|nr:SDR family oxidoreductase [Variovorax sp. J31P179]MDM0085375.1 SDR family oxidoreductase [Variovorax sp. J31P179]